MQQGPVSVGCRINGFLIPNHLPRHKEVILLFFFFLSKLDPCTTVARCEWLACNRKKLLLTVHFPLDCVSH